MNNHCRLAEKRRAGRLLLRYFAGIALILLLALGSAVGQVSFPKPPGPNASPQEMAQWQIQQEQAMQNMQMLMAVIQKMFDLKSSMIDNVKNAKT